MLRSMLFCPADSPTKLEKACASGADAVILDLEDSVALARKAEARGIAAEFLKGRARGPQLWVRINPLGSGLALDDLAGVVAAGPDGVVLPKPDSAADLTTLDNYLSAFEAAAGRAIGGIRVLPIATETARAVFTLGGYAGAPRLAGLTWGAEDLPGAVGALSNRLADGSFTDLCRLARSLVVAGAAAAGVPALETVYPDFRDVAGVEAYAAQGRREGFSGMLAIHPAQVEPINRAFTPSEAELEEARAILALFAANPTAGALNLDGRMVDMPHLIQAKRLLGS